MSADIQIISVIGANGQPLPIHGNSIGSNWSAPVKQERADEAEIQELAAKMLETQKAALAKQQQQAAQIANRQQQGGASGAMPVGNGNNGQANILNYLTRQQKPNGANAVPSNGNGRSVAPGAQQNGGGDGASADRKAPCDEESQKGHFGWTTFGKTYIPYIYRQQEKYCSVRMIEMKLLGKYLNCLHPDIYSSCTCVRSYYITEAEARLLIEINIKHCDAEFGRDIFTQKDLVVRLSDATKFYQFLDICYRKLISGSKSPSEKCGFIRINKESVVPYTVRNNEQVVPLFYFEGETENLKMKADYLSGWDLAYLKFCCKVQGIRNELFSSENVAVISLTDIKSYFPNGTEFEDYWPSKVVDSNLLIGNRTNANNSVNWTRQPTQPPPKVMPQSNLLQKQTSAAQQQQQMMKRGNNAYAQQSPAAAAAAAAAAAMQQQQQPGQRMLPSNATMATVQALTNSWMQQQPLIHAQMLASQAQQPHPNSRTGQYQRSPMENILLGNRPTYATYNNPAISMQPVNSHNQANAPPPLVRSGAGQNANHMSNVEHTMLQQQTQLQQRHSSNSSSSANPSSHNSSRSSPTTHLTTTHASKQSAHNTLSHVGSSSTLNPFNYNFPSTTADVAFWNQLTPAQRLLLTQQVKSNGTVAGATASSGARSSSAITQPSKPPNFPIFPSLPLDTDLKTMLDYNPHKHSNKSSNSSTTSSSAIGQFTKPSVPPLIPVITSSDNMSSKRSTTRHSSNASSTIPLNSAASLEDFEKKFKMTDEMKAVVQKVLSNPDLSTFIQTNSSQNFVPFMSPPISPAPSLSIVPNPNVTITPHIPSQYAHSTPPSSSGGNSSSGRQKSVICSTNSALNVPPSPSTSNSTATPSPSPTRTHGSSSGPSKSGSHYSSQHYNSLQNQHSSHHHHNSHNQQQNHHQNTPPMEVIDLSSPRRSVQAASAYLQQQQEVHNAAVAAVQQQQRLAAAAQHHAQQNGRNSGSSSANANSASMHLQRHAAMAAAAAANNAQRLSIIPEMQQYERTATNMGQPYKVQKVYVDNRLVPCINMKAFNDSDQLMTLTDFQKNFFPHESLENCKVLIETLGVELYKGNRRQMQVLMENDRSHNDNIPLVQVRDVMKYMKQLLFMTRNQEQPPSKRTRIS
ncbi:uncharacterized protein [Eurosta solidaginis]|uniref:uncharacterized protein n=1 Tax=Eurosta solidaginis TaxID=178769 RepID=UPI0035309276